MDFVEEMTMNVLGGELGRIDSRASKTKRSLNQSGVSPSKVKGTLDKAYKSELLIHTHK